MVELPRYVHTDQARLHCLPITSLLLRLASTLFPEAFVVTPAPSLHPKAYHQTAEREHATDTHQPMGAVPQSLIELLIIMMYIVPHVPGLSRIGALHPY
jgi:hypothetical protein